MKTILIALSVLANLALAWHLQATSSAAPVRVNRSSETGRSVPDGPRSTRGEPITLGPLPAPGAPAAPKPRVMATASSGAPRSAPAWTTLESADPQEFASRLAGAGWSQADIRAALEGRFAGELSARRKEMEAATPGNPYWTYPSSISEKRTELSAANLAELRQLARAQAKAVDEAAGPSGIPVMPPTFDDQRRFDGIPQDKIRFVRTIEEDYDDLATVAKRDMAIFPFPEDNTRLGMVAAAKKKDLEEVLTPEEYEEYQLRNSTTADKIRNQLVAFQPTEAEFRAIFHAEEGTHTSVELNAKLQEVLGGRYSAYQQAIVPANRMAWIKANTKR